MKMIRFERASIKTIFSINPEKVLWVEFLNGSQIKKLTLRFADSQSLSVTENQIGKEKFETLKNEFEINEPTAGYMPLS